MLWGASMPMGTSEGYFCCHMFSADRRGGGFAAVGSMVVLWQEPKGQCDWDGVAGHWNGAAQLGSLLTLSRSCLRETMPSLRKTFFR